ncbi:circularly permuted type 2 ATP-grasp protein [Agitococcus lubricus]|uniref:Putative circularly permuted ATP-grasp superfamily protein n=1 Tax=Agitococcus lubricus TaxID=1077255 RepID=A0A2T5J3M3_9GAMM|nr:circularly permuted type 2 ATP-grasp protein [Agitococcus lubricus]PTQ91201.1 putative circularly permuted ATP-grasp superfamily protein [Agitococcus lubricus]
MPTLFDAYQVDSSRYNEIFAADGTVHPHWYRFATTLQSMTASQMQERADLVAQQIHENGVTYNVYADPQGTNRPWRLGPIPNLIPAEQWQVLAEGITQRATLLNAMLADIYGEQRLIREGLIPAELIYGHNNFLRPCMGIKQPHNTFLHVYAADVARDANGQWWIMADRTQTPSGAGYALENRQIIARAFPELYRQLKVQSLNDYFLILRQTLSRLSPSSGEAPLIVLLTSGRFNETYFEHIYLARHMGIPLVEGYDLTVRGSVVYLKTLNGLKRVHVILRRLDDDYCDPLELRSDSALGVAGLLDAVRSGTVLVANALGSGVLESAGLLGFLPNACQYLLKEPLKLPSIATWWCGEDPVREEALSKLNRLVVKPAFPSQRFEPVFGEKLSKKELESLKRRIERRPYAYVAQELVALAQSPVWHKDTGQFQAQSSGMRVYAVASDEGYSVMAGGLSRVASHHGANVVSMQRGGISKDTWVCFGQSTRTEKPKVRTIGVRDLLRQDPYLPSRVAENMFWLGRYSERCDNNARLLRSALSRHIELAGDSDLSLEIALESCQFLGLYPEDKDLSSQLLAGICDAKWGSSLVSNLRSLIWSASQVRGRLSQENWITIAELQQEADSLRPEQLELGQALSFVDRLLMSLSSLAGFAMDDMTQDNSWRFLMLGRRLERLQFLADMIAQLLQTNAAIEQTGLDWLLELADSTITYRSRYLSSAQLIPVLDLILLDPSNPHSLQFQLDTLLAYLAQLDHDNDYGLAALRERLRSLNFDVLESEMDYPTRLPRALGLIAVLLQDIARTGRDLSDHLSLRYFAHIDTISQPTVSA